MPKAGIAQVVRRWRHTRGFGVHSPGAFALLNYVIRSKEHYYGYYDIDVALRNYPRVRWLKADCLLLLRLIGRLAPKYVVILSDHRVPLLAAVRAGDSRLQPETTLDTPRESRLIYASRGLTAVERTVLIKQLTIPDTVLITRGWNEAEREETVRAVSGGIVFSGKNLQLIFTRSGMPRMQYLISL